MRIVSKRPQILLILLVLSLTAMTPAPSGTLRCISANSEAQLQVLLQRFDSLYFFASWCPFCPKGLQEADPTRTLFVVFRDGAEAASTCFYRYQPNGTCLLDPDGILAKRFSIEEVPALRHVPPVRGPSK